MMSDPVTNAEIEDVLSSIRRLVSEDSRNVLRKKPAGLPPEQGRLVLTPALRVAGDPAPAEDVATQDTFSPILPVPDDATDEALSDVAADVDVAAVADGAPPWNNPDTTLFEAVGGHLSDAANADDTVPDPADWPEAQPGDEDADPDAEETEPGDTNDWLADPADDTDTGMPDAELPDISDQDAGNTDAGNTVSLGATVEALETTIGETRDQWEPDGEGGDDYAGTPVQTLQWEDHDGDTAPDADSGLHEVQQAWRTDDDFAEQDGAPDDDELDPLNAEEAVLDEESLRELVTDIVRQELQGGLGERITRNVRKLVRREIQRALAAQELE